MSPWPWWGHSPATAHRPHRPCSLGCAHWSTGTCIADFPTHYDGCPHHAGLEAQPCLCAHTSSDPTSSLFCWLRAFSCPHHAARSASQPSPPLPHLAAAVMSLPASFLLGLVVRLVSSPGWLGSHQSFGSYCTTAQAYFSRSLDTGKQHLLLNPE